MKAGASFLNDMLALSHVPRWAIVRHAVPQSVADHSFRVAAIVIELWLRLGPPEVNLGNLVIRALTHDVNESVTSDIPSVIKDRSIVPAQYTKPVLLDFTRQELDLVSLAGKLEEYTWIVMNGTGYHAQEVADSLLQALKDRYDQTPAGDILPDLIREIVMEEGRLRTHADFPASQEPR